MVMSNYLRLFSEMMGGYENAVYPNPNMHSDYVQQAFRTVSKSVVYLVLLMHSKQFPNQLFDIFRATYKNKLSN
jgi:hypothetical protein